MDSTYTIVCKKSITFFGGGSFFVILSKAKELSILLHKILRSPCFLRMTKCIVILSKAKDLITPTTDSSVATLPQNDRGSQSNKYSATRTALGIDPMRRLSHKIHKWYVLGRNGTTDRRDTHIESPDKIS